MSATSTSGRRRPTPEELEALPLLPPSRSGLAEVIRRRYLLKMLVRNEIESR